MVEMFFEELFTPLLHCKMDQLKKHIKHQLRHAVQCIL